jgi:predicted nucleotide-binding protein
MKEKGKPPSKPLPAAAEDKKQVRISQADVPSYSLTEAIKVVEAIFDNYGGKPTKPLNVAGAMNVSPQSSNFRQITGAAIAYGITDGGYNAPEIAISSLGKQIVAPTEEGMDLAAKRTAFLKPRVISEFAKKYDGHNLPRTDIAVNVLVEMGVPKERAEPVLALILDGAQSLGLIQEIKGKKYLDLQGEHQQTPAETLAQYSIDDANVAEEDAPVERSSTAATRQPEAQNPSSVEATRRLKRVFITHGKNKEFVEPIRKLLSFGELEAVVSVEKQTVSQPVPDKVMNDMRSCGAAIIHVDGELQLIDKDANSHVVLNPNVLIEIGAAMALYGRRFILLVKNGVQLPSNLQGLFEVRYNGDQLDGDATIRLLEAIRQLKEVPLTS